MAIRSFNINEKIYEKYKKKCKEEGISMSKRVENFIRRELESEMGDEGKKGKKDKGDESHLEGEEHTFQRYC